MKSEVITRMAKLRELMRENGLSAYLINGSDPHMSEYVPARWQSRAFISGFSGSYGWLAVTLDKAVLWTDSRYYLQAAQQLEGTGIEMLKARLPESISTEQWIANELKQGETVGFDGTCYSTSEVKSFEKLFTDKGINMNFQIDLLDKVWNDRPVLSGEKAFLHPVRWAGVSRNEKFSIISQELEKQDADVMVISALDDLAWTFNIRGADVDYNPVVLAFGLVEKEKAQLFINNNKLNDVVKQELLDDGIELFEYDHFYSQLENIKGKKVFIDPDRSNSIINHFLKGKNTIIEGLSIPNILKSCKNEAEIIGMKKAHVADGLALLNFQMWLEETLGKESVTEYDAAEKLVEFRSKQFGYRGASFYPIMGYRDHGAIVHFSVKPDTANVLKPEGVLLFDSGGQYEFGTTDITRTIALGPVSDQMKKDFTLVLKGTINLTRIKFPKGVLGYHLDILAREALWRENLNYGHGTGHGVGAFLNVHEGPGSIRAQYNNVPIRPGNIFSNEPGLYREGQYGMRTENLMLCVEDISNEFGEFYRFETITKFPIDTRLIEKSLLTNDEIDWINKYHRSVLTALSPFTSSEEFKLLKRLTAFI